MWHKGSLGDENDARTSNTCIAQRNRSIPHSKMKNNRNVIECCNNTHRGRHVPANKHALALRTSVTLVTLLVSMWHILYASECISMCLRCRIQLPDDGIQTYLRALRENVRPDVTRMVVCILSSQRKDKYDALKVYLCVENPGDCKADIAH